ncbi:hypothetical protein [Acidovorax sacchari]|uniref:hypothetical protein n=1 Tax=Acidovorax sacchari TaxID=3230736 RepID=UPI0039E42ADD
MTGIDSAMAGLLAGPGARGGRDAAEGREPPGLSPALRQAWLREMERAQLAGWFQPFAPAAMPQPSGAAARPSQGLPTAMPSAARAASGLPAAYRAMPVPPANRGSMPASASGEDAPGTVSADRSAVAGGVAGPRHSDGGALGMPDRGGSDGMRAAPAPGAGGDAWPHPALAGASAPMPLASALAGRGAAASAGIAAADQATAAIGSGAVERAAAIVDRAMAPAWRPDGVRPLAVPLPAALAAASTSAPMESGDGPAEHSGRTASGAAPGAARSLPAEAQRSTGMRVHAQWSDAGAQLWLGMDGTADQVGYQAAAVVPSLERALREQGQRLVRVVCNGRVVFDAFAPASRQAAGPSRFTDVFSTAAQRIAPRARNVFSSSIFQEGNP